MQKLELATFPANSLLAGYLALETGLAGLHPPPFDLNDLVTVISSLYFPLPKLRPENPVRAAFRWSDES
jgi:hypothetical protein